MTPLSTPLSPISRAMLDNATVQSDKTTSSGSGARGTLGTHTASTAKGAEGTPLQQAARDFEAVFLRQILSALEGTTKVSSKGNSLAGQQAYGSMIVDAVAEAVAKAGGLGIADVLANTLSDRAQPTATAPLKVPPSVPGMKPNQNPTGSGSATGSPPISEDVRISPQGLSRVAVPRTEIRASAAPIKGPLADRRIR